jgi:hypothetical protein
MNLASYINGLVNAALGRSTEGFIDANTSPITVLSWIQTLYGSIPILLILHFVMVIIYGAGAARLSYCYQMSTNPAATLFYLYIAMAFLFSPVYYPYYAIFLSQCGRR